MKEIRLSQASTKHPRPKNEGKYVALVDDEDYPELMKHKWTAKVMNHTVYATRMNINGTPKTIKMHRQIMGVLDEGVLIDHKDGEGLNNQRNNLRTCTVSENLRNKTSTKGVSKFKGVAWLTRERLWRASICADKKNYKLGYFKCESCAAWAYDVKAKELHGEFAVLNFRTLPPQH